MNLGGDVTDEERINLCEWLHRGSVGWSGSPKMAQAANELERLVTENGRLTQALIDKLAEPKQTDAEPIRFIAGDPLPAPRGKGTQQSNAETYGDQLRRVMKRQVMQSDAEPVAWQEALEQQLSDLVELARDTRSNKGGPAQWMHPIGALVSEFTKRIASLRPDAQPNAEPVVSVGLIEAAEWHEKMANMLRAGARATREQYDCPNDTEDDDEAELHEVAAMHFRSRAKRS